MNISLGARLADGRRVGIEWHRKRTSRGTVISAVLRHEGELSPDDLDRVLAEIGAGERMLEAGRAPKRRRPLLS